MPFALSVVFSSYIKGLALSRTWSSFAVGRIATSTRLSHSRKFLIGSFSALEISFLYLLSIAPSKKLSISDKFQSLFKLDVESSMVSYEYKVIREVGNGTFGSVWRAISKQSGEVVAIKKMKKKYYSWEECLSLREVKSLRKMNHPNIVKLKEVIRENDVLYFVFEYMECNLYQLMKDRWNFFSEAEVRNWCFQVFQGLAYMHQRGYFHRDLKPENLLVAKDTIKIADFGLAREINSRPPFTEYVSTRWYRAPEVLLQSPIYGAPVDMWAMGAIMAELFTLCPLFPGSSVADEIYKICCIIGSPTKSEWAEGLELANAINYQFPQIARVHLSALLPGVSEDAVDLIASLCSWDPNKRPTALEALQYPFFQSCFYVPPSLRHKAAARTPPSAGTRGAWEQSCGKRYPVNVSNVKQLKNTFSSGKPQPYANAAGVQRKLDLNNKDMANNGKNPKINVKMQPRYQPPGMNGPSAGNLWRGRQVSDSAEKFGNVKIGPRRPLAKPCVPPPPMKAGGWHGRSEEVIQGRVFPSTRLQDEYSSAISA